MSPKMREFLEKLSDLMEEYNVKIEQDYDAPNYITRIPYLEFDLQESPYDTVRFEEIYLDYNDIRSKINEQDI